LRLLQELRDLLSLPIPLVWNPSFQDLAAIEVYPAGTLTAYGFRASGYKATGQVAEREEIIRSISRHMKIRPGQRHMLAQNADVLDAAVCLLAARDFLVGDVIEPENLQAAEREGWIWVKDSE
jgi:hypothetical protein